MPALVKISDKQKNVISPPPPHPPSLVDLKTHVFLESLAPNEKLQNACTVFQPLARLEKRSGIKRKPGNPRQGTALPCAVTSNFRSFICQYRCIVLYLYFIHLKLVWVGIIGGLQETILLLCILRVYKPAWFVHFGT